MSLEVGGPALMLQKSGGARPYVLPYYPNYAPVKAKNIQSKNTKMLVY